MKKQLLPAFVEEHFADNFFSTHLDFKSITCNHYLLQNENTSNQFAWMRFYWSKENQLRYGFHSNLSKKSVVALLHRHTYSLVFAEGTPFTAPEFNFVRKIINDRYVEKRKWISFWASRPPVKGVVPTILQVCPSVKAQGKPVSWLDAADCAISNSCALFPTIQKGEFLLPEGLTAHEFMLVHALGKYEEAVAHVTANRRQDNVTRFSPKPKKAKPKKKEIDYEAELLSWLDSRGVIAEQQVISQGKRTDIWLPGKAFLELKRGRITGDDVCQAAEYFTAYRKQIILVGKSMSSRVGDGISAINELCGEEAIVFVTWGGIRTFLAALTRR